MTVAESFMKFRVVNAYDPDPPSLGATMDWDAVPERFRAFATEVDLGGCYSCDIDLMFETCHDAFLTFPGMTEEALAAHLAAYKAAIRDDVPTLRSTLDRADLPTPLRKLVFDTPFGLTALHDAGAVVARRSSEIVETFRLDDVFPEVILAACAKASVVVQARKEAEARALAASEAQALAHDESKALAHHESEAIAQEEPKAVAETDPVEVRPKAIVKPSKAPNPAKSSTPSKASEGPLPPSGGMPLNGAETRFANALLGKDPMRKADAARLVGSNRGVANRALDGLVAKRHAREVEPGLFALTELGISSSGSRRRSDPTEASTCVSTDDTDDLRPDRRSVAA